jgi:hypothetical protein
MANRNNSGFGFRKIVIPITTEKIIFYNSHKPIVIKFRNNNTKALELLMKGINSLCLCDDDWKRTVFRKPLIVYALEPVTKYGQHYYLRIVTTSKAPKNYLSICVEKTGCPLTFPFLCIIQIRSQNYTDCGTIATLNMEHLVPETVRNSIGEHAYKMQTHFPGISNFIKSCTNYRHSYCHTEIIDT